MWENIQDYKNLSWVWGADRKIHPRLCWMMPNIDPEGQILLLAPNNSDRFFFLHNFLSQVFYFNLGVAIDKSCTYTLTSDIFTWPPIQPMYWQHVLLIVFFIYPMGPIRVCKIRFVSTGENCGKPCLVCKKHVSKNNNLSFQSNSVYFLTWCKNK